MDVYLEAGVKRVFACAVDWPGLCRAGRDEQQALDALGAALPRYARVAVEAGEPAPAANGFAVVERVKGSASTDYGVPGTVRAADAHPLEAAEAERLIRLVQAAWTVLDDVAAHAPAELRKGPRGGGRDRDQIVDHVVRAEEAYAAKLNLRLRSPSAADTHAVKAFRAAIVQALQDAGIETKWPPRYAARRIAWHALDHAWEIEDRTESKT